MVDWKNKNDAVYDIANWISKNPDHMTDFVLAIQRGIYDRLMIETNHRNTAETALILTYPRTKVLPEHHRQIAVRAIKNSLSYGNTPFAHKLKVDSDE